jgi:hypothetical protein
MNDKEFSRLSIRRRQGRHQDARVANVLNCVARSRAGSSTNAGWCFATPERPETPRDDSDEGDHRPRQPSIPARSPFVNGGIKCTFVSRPLICDARTPAGVFQILTVLSQHRSGGVSAALANQEVGHDPIRSSLRRRPQVRSLVSFEIRLRTPDCIRRSELSAVRAEHYGKRPRRTSSEPSKPNRRANQDPIISAPDRALNPL